MIITLSSLQLDGNHFSTVVLIPQLMLNSQAQSQKGPYLRANDRDSQRNLFILPCCFILVKRWIDQERAVLSWNDRGRNPGYAAGLTCSYMCVVHFLQTNPNLRLKLPYESHLVHFQAQHQALAQDLSLELRSGISVYKDQNLSNYCFPRKNFHFGTL